MGLLGHCLVTLSMFKCLPVKCEQGPGNRVQSARVEAAKSSVLDEHEVDDEPLDGC